MTGRPTSARCGIDVQIEHDRGPFNGLAEIAGRVLDITGGRVATGATVTVREILDGAVRDRQRQCIGAVQPGGAAGG